MSRPGPARRRLDELLADGAWHNTDQAIAVAATAVPPGTAARHADHIRAAKRDRHNRLLTQHGVAPRRAQGGPARGDVIRVGAHNLARRAVEEAVRRGAYQRRTLPDGTVQIRRRPETGVE